MKAFKLPIKITQEVKLRRPHLLAAGPGTGNAGLLAVDYIRRCLEAQPFAEIERDYFYTAPFIVRVEDGLLKLDEMAWEGEKPENKFYCWKSRRSHDLILFTGSAQPLPGKSSELAARVMEVAQGFKVERVYIAGAFATDIHHNAEPEVMGLASHQRLLNYLEGQGLRPPPPMNIAFNLNVFLTGTAMQRGIEVIGLVAEAPFYAVEQAYFKASLALVRRFCPLLGIEAQVDTADLEKMVAAQEKKIDSKIEELRGSTDEKAAAFLEYLEILEKRQKEGRTPPPPKRVVLVPDSLKPIAALYQTALKDKSQVGQLQTALNKLSHDERMQVLRVFGAELLELIQRK